MPRPASTDVDGSAATASNTAPVPLASLSQRQRHDEKAPPAPDFQAVEIETVVIDAGVFPDCHPASVIPAIADRDSQRLDVHGLTAFACDVGGEGASCLRECPDRGNGVSQPSLATFAFGRQFAGEGHTQPDAGDVEKRVTVDDADVDAAHVTCCNHRSRRGRVRGYAQCARKVVRGAERQDPERQARFKQTRSSSVDGPVSATDDDEVDIAQHLVLSD